jgi:hypothetical protein
MSLQTPNVVQTLRGALRAKAKGSSEFRFDSPHGLTCCFGERTEPIGFEGGCAQTQNAGKGTTRFSFAPPYEELGFVLFRECMRSFPWANA